MNANLQQSIFSVEKIKNVVNVGGSSAYQIYTTPGEQIGTLGKLDLAGLDRSANQANYAPESSKAVTSQAPVSWLKKSLTAIVG